MPNRSIIYIDGFNLYNRLLVGGPLSAYKWLDLEKFFVKLRQGDDIHKVKYFTAHILGGLNGSRGRQMTYLKALESTPLVQVIPGSYATNEVRCRVRGCTHNHRAYNITQEKRTDVAIGVSIVDDALNDRMDRLVLITGDSDLVPALELVKRARPNIQRIVYVPSRQRSEDASSHIRSAATKAKNLPTDLFRHCQLPTEVRCGNYIAHKPKEW